jgi:hypothetical protein
MASPNPFLEAIKFNIPSEDSTPIPSANDFLANMHGADISSTMPTVTYSPDFIKAMSAYTKSSTTPAQLTQALQSAQQSASQGGFDLLHWLGNVGSAVWKDLKGGLAGAQVNEANEQGPFSVIPGFFWGLRHPGQALQEQQKLYQAVDQDVAKQHAPQWVKNAENFTNHFVLSAGSDPLTFTPLPIGTAAKVLKMVPGVDAGLNALKGALSAAKESKAVKPLVEQLGKNFVKYYGASPELKSALQTRDNLMNFYGENIRRELEQLAKQHALTPEEMNLLPHVWEGTETTNNEKILQAIKDLQDILENGRGNFAGLIGTKAERTTLLNGQPILQRLRANYFPHMYLDDEETVRKILEGTPTKSFSTTGPFNQAREFNTLKEAIEAGLTPELNPYVAVANRLMQSARALTNARLINDLLAKGIISTKEVPGFVRSNVLNSLKWLDQRVPEPKPVLQETVPNELAHQYKNNYTPEELNVLEQTFREQRDAIQNELKSLPVLARELRDTEAQKGYADLLKRIRELGGIRSQEGDAFHTEFRELPKSVQSAVRAVVTVPKERLLGADEFKLPKELSKSAPRYRSHPVEFANDLDKAAYIVRSSKNLSARDADFLKLLMEHTGLSEQEARGLGEKVKQAIKQASKGAAEGETIKLPPVLSSVTEKVRVGSKGLPIDEMADQLGMSVNSLLEALANATTGQGRLRVSDFLEEAKKKLGHDEKLQDLQEIERHLNAIASAKQLHKLDEIAAARDGAPGLDDEANFASLLSTLGPDEAKPGVVRYYVRPEDETAFKQALQPYEPKGAFVNLFDKAMGAWKWGTLLNPAVHGHNIFYNGMYLGGASPKGFAEMFRSIKNNPLQNEWYQRALKAGAISADRGGGIEALRKAVESASNPNPVQKALSAVKYATHDVLWDADKALRTQLFRQAVERGMSDEEAAKFVNKFMVDYNNTTPFEEKYLTRIFPFYRWMKGNLPLQIEQWINNTPKQAWYEAIKNATSNGLSGQDTNGGKINTGIRLPDGSVIMIDPYAPADEPLKAMQEGLLPFLYGKVSPVVKEPIAQILNQAYYPGSTESAVVPSDKRGMTQTTITTPGAGTLDNLAARVNHAASSLLPLSGVIGSIVGAKENLSSALGQPTKERPGETALEAITRLLGGFTSRDNPALDEYYQERQQQDDLKKLIARLKKSGQPVPQELTKAAYAKIPFPMTGQ